MSKSQPVTQTTNTSQSIPDWLTQATQQVAGQATALPTYTPYTGQGVAPLTQQQIQAGQQASTGSGGQGVVNGGVAGAQNALNFAAPNVDANSLSSQVQGLLNPATQNVIDTTNAQLDKNTTQGVNAEDNNLAAQHAFGGSRQAVADSIIQNQGAMTKASTDASLNQGNYNTALSTALSAGQGNQNAAINSAGVNTAATNALTGAGSALSGINTNDITGLLNSGGIAQNTGTAADQFNYQNYLNSYQIPDQQATTAASTLGSLPYSTTGTSQTTGNTYTNSLLGALGLGTSAAGLFGTPAAGGTSAASGIGSALSGLFALSDRRHKEGVEQVGMLFDGTPVYRFRYITGGPRVHIGLMAQDVEKFAPQAVREIEGTKFVDYGAATNRARALAETI